MNVSLVISGLCTHLSDMPLRCCRVLSIVLMILIAPSSYAQKTAFINEAQLLQSTPGYMEAIREMDNIKADFQKEIVQSQTIFIEKVSKLLARYNMDINAGQEAIERVLSEHDLKKWRLLQEENALLVKQIQAKEEEYQFLYSQKAGSIVEKVNAVVTAFCKSKEIALLYKLDQLQTSMAYIDPELDITKELVQEVLRSIK